MAGFAPLTNHTHFSLLRGVSKPKQIAKRCVELGYSSVAMTDYGNVGCAVQFLKGITEVCVCGHQKDDHIDGGKCKSCKCTKFEKYKLKPILGMEAYITQDISQPETDSHNLSFLPVLAKNLDGWKSLISATSYGYHKDHQYVDNDDNVFPRIESGKLADLGKGNLIAFSGHQWSEVANSIFIDHKIAYGKTDYDEIKELHVHPDWEKRILRVSGDLIEMFGKDNFYLSVQFSGTKYNPAALIAARAVRYVAKKYKIQRFASHNSYYPTKVDAPDQRVLICADMNVTAKEIKRRLDRGDESTSYIKANFMGDDFHIPSLNEIQVNNDDDELVNSLKIADMCEEYDIRHPPIIPEFPCPDNLSASEYLKKICVDGWNYKVKPKIPADSWPELKERIKHELGVICKAGLDPYFLIVQEYCNWARSQGMVLGPGRGSGAGSMAGWLSGITTVNPKKYGLIFERFYNDGRNTPGHISLPDYDVDFPVGRRKEVVTHIKDMYGHDKVANIATFNSMKGKGAITEVFRAHDVEFGLIKQITALIPDESRITEELQAMKDRGDEPSIIRYALEIDPDSFRDYVTMDDAGKCEGVFGGYFEQAMRLEGTKRNISMHAAGVVLSTKALADQCPLYYDEQKDVYLACMEYPDLEAMGMVKLDILGVNALDKINSVRDLLKYGYIDKEDAD